MAFTNIPNGNLQVGAPLRSVDILALRDNIPAVMNGDTGAPKIKAAAFEGQSGAAPVFAARAWVNFDGTGTVAIRASGNVSSITDNGVGDYTLNFATAMPDANYVVNAMPVRAAGANNRVVNQEPASAPTNTTVRIRVSDADSNVARDTAGVFASIFR